MRPYTGVASGTEPHRRTLFHKGAGECPLVLGGVEERVAGVRVCNGGAHCVVVDLGDDLAYEIGGLYEDSFVREGKILRDLHLPAADAERRVHLEWTRLWDSPSANALPAVVVDQLGHAGSRSRDT
jgi:hypothetical protein